MRKADSRELAFCLVALPSLLVLSGGAGLRWVAAWNNHNRDK